MKYKYKKSVLGGTFDNLHIGHKKLIDTAFEQSEFVEIGISEKKLFQHKLLSNVIEDYLFRKRNLEIYLKSKKFDNRAKFTPINTIFGNTLIEKNIDAIFVTEETLPNANLINKKRKENGFSELAVVLVPFVKSSDGKNITSERIRKGEIDRYGFVYKSIFDKKYELILPEKLRPILQEPIGEVIRDTSKVLNLLTKKSIIIAVGDIIVNELKKTGINPAISIIDFRSRRHPLIENFPGGKIVNRAGTINRNAVSELKNLLESYLQSKESQDLQIEGEEDLLALPAILLAPLNSIVLYGQFDQGVVVNRVTEKLKSKIRALLEKFN